MVIDLVDALQALAGVVDEHGAEHRHRARWHPTLRRRSWRYQVDGSPACIVGVVLSRFGVTAADLDTLGERSMRELFVLRELPVEVTLGAAVVLERAQQVQDAGGTWGEAYRFAVRAAERFGDLVVDHRAVYRGDAVCNGSGLGDSARP